MSRREFSEPIAFRGFGRLACSGLLHSLLLATAFGQTNASLLPPATDRRIDFAMDVAPLLQQRCQSCHGDALASSGLRLDSREAALRGGYSGVVIQPGNSRESKLIQLVAGLNELVMPMSGDRLTPDQIGVLRAWIDQGADWPETNAAAANAKAGAENLRHNSENPKSEPPQAHSSHWAFNPPHRPQLPDVANSDWVRNPIDRFVLARLEAEGIQPSPEAEKTTLIRRLSLDLIGLPPTPAEVEQFVSDDNPKAYEKASRSLVAFAALRRKMGAALAGSGALRRQRRFRNRRPSPARLALPPLGHQRAQPQHAVLINSRSSNSPEICCPTPPSSSGSQRASTATR